MTIAATLHQAGDFFPELEQWKAPKIPRPKVVNSRRERVVEPDEFARLIQVLTRPPDAQDGAREYDRRTAYIARLRVAHIFQFAMATGMRHSEIIGLEWKSAWNGNRLTGQIIGSWSGKEKLAATNKSRGHSAKELIVHYAHHSPASMSRAAAALEEITSLPQQDDRSALEQASSL